MASSLTAPPPVSPASSSAGDDRMVCGTLRYTKRGLVLLFVWMLWGDFCFQIMEQVMPKLLPLQLKDLKASNVVIGMLVGSLPGVTNMIVTPIVSFRSDRYRSRWGRRIPFLLIPAPLVTFCLILLAYAGEIGRGLHHLTNPVLGFSPTATVLLTTSLLIIAFKFFDMFGASVYYYLFNDVVPPAFLGRFLALFRVVGYAAGFVFNWFIFGYARTHMKEIYLGAALLYLAAFTLMCLFVKEGRYPPPPPRRDGPGLLSAAKTYFRECFSIPFYVLLFVKTALWSLSNTIGLFSVFFAQDLGLSLEQIGKINAYTGLLTVVLMYPMGWLSDRFHPMRMYLLSMLLTIPMTVLSFFLIHGLVSYTALSMIKVPIGALMSATSLPLVMLLFPKDRFGQFASAQAMVNAAVVVAGNFAAGKFMDWIGDYRYLWVWMFFFEVLALLFMLLVYRGWQRHGGREHYQSP